MSLTNILISWSKSPQYISDGRERGRERGRKGVKRRTKKDKQSGNGWRGDGECLRRTE